MSQLPSVGARVAVKDQPVLLVDSRQAHGWCRKAASISSAVCVCVVCWEEVTRVIGFPLHHQPTLHASGCP